MLSYQLSRLFSVEWLANQFELSRGSNVGNIKPMEGLRGIAVFLVFLVHYVSLIEPWLSGGPAVFFFTKALHKIGNTGVDLFFVLSGYLIYGSLIERSQRFLSFMKRRIKRIYPAFLVVFVIYCFLSFAFPGENKIPQSAADGALYILQNILLLPGLFPIEPLITVAWSLSYEMLYYLTIPIVIVVFMLRDRSPTWRVAFFIFAAALIAAYCAVNGGHIRLIMFIAGILLYELMKSDRVPPPESYIGLFAVTTGLLSALLPASGNIGNVLKICILFVTFLLLCQTCFRSPLGWLSNLICWTPLRWLGNMSYSYYLLHGLALKAAFLILSKIMPSAQFEFFVFFALLPLMFALTLIPTSILFCLVERPFSLSSSKSAGGSYKRTI